MPRFSSPLLPWMLSLAVGILLGPHLSTLHVWITVPVALFIGVVRPRWAFLAAILLGAGLRGWHEPHPVELIDDGYPLRVTGVLDNAPESRNSGYYLDIDLEAAGEQPWSGGARLSFFPATSDIDQLFRQLDLGAGDRIEVLVRLRSPTEYRNPGVFSYKDYLELRGIYWTGSIRNPRLIQVLDRGWHGLDRIRDWATDRIGRHFQDDSARAALALGMVLGQRRRLPAQTAKDFEAAGLIHLLVVSGFNLAVVAAGAFWLGRHLPFPFQQRAAGRCFALGIVLGYATLVEGNAPVMRATLMAVLLIAGSLTDRGHEVGNALGVAGSVILLIRPLAILDSSFQLTFAALVAILGIGVPAISWGMRRMQVATRQLGNTEADPYLPAEVTDWRVSQRLRCELKGRPLWPVWLKWSAVRFLAEAALITVSVQTALFPLMVESYHRMSPITLPLNLLGALIAAVVTPLGLLLIPTPQPVAGMLAWVMNKLLGVFLLAVGQSLEIPGATWRVPSPPIWMWILYGLTLGILAWALRKRSIRQTAWVAFTLAGLQTAVATVDFAPAPPARPTLTFLDVGQGDSTLIELPDARRVVVDAGGAPSFGGGSDQERTFSIGEDVVSAHLFSRGIRRLDAVVLTHAHSDHMDGMFDLIENFQIGEVWLGRNPVVPRYRELLERIYRRQIPIRWLVAGATIGPFTVLNPHERYRVGTEVRNDESLVLMLEWNHATALLTGDYEGTLPDLSAQVVDVLKVPHHGSANARLEIESRIPVISVGATNSFGHPAASKLPALRTDLLGAIRVVLDTPYPGVTFPALRDQPYAR